MRSRYEEGVLHGLHLAEEHILLRAEFAKRRTGSGDMIGPMEELAKEIGQIQVQVMTGTRSVEGPVMPGDLSSPQPQDDPAPDQAGRPSPAKAGAAKGD